MITHEVLPIFPLNFDQICVLFADIMKFSIGLESLHIPTFCAKCRKSDFEQRYGHEKWSRKIYRKNSKCKGTLNIPILTPLSFFPNRQAQRTSTPQGGQFHRHEREPLLVGAPSWRWRPHHRIPGGEEGSPAYGLEARGKHRRHEDQGISPHRGRTVRLPGGS